VANDGVGPSHDGPQPLGDRAQQQVADVVTEGIVDRLEVVEVEKEQRRLASDRIGAGHGVAQPLIDQKPIV